jgi:DNA-binding PadR family transcriptional regulator
MAQWESNETVTSENEWIAFAFACFGCPSLAEIEKFCALCGYRTSLIERALKSLCRKGFIVVHRHEHRRKGPRDYIPTFYTLTEAGFNLFKKNYVSIMDFLLSRIVFECASQGNADVAN